MPVTENAYALTTLAEVLKELKHKPTSDHQDAIQRAVNAMTARFQGPRGCNRRLRSQTYIHDGDVSGDNLERLQPQTSRRLILRNPPITNIASLVPYNGATAFTESVPGSSAGDYVVNRRSGIITLVNNAVFSYPTQPSVEITYTGGFIDDDAAGFSDAQKEEWGWSRWAADVSRYCARQIAHEYRKARKGWEGVQSVSEANTTLTLSAEPWLPEVRDVLDGLFITQVSGG